MSDELDPIPFDDTPIEIDAGADAASSPVAEPVAEPVATPSAGVPRKISFTGKGATRVKSFHGGRLPLIQSLALRDSFDDVHQDYLARELLLGQTLRGGRPDVPGSYDCDLVHL